MILPNRSQPGGARLIGETSAGQAGFSLIETTVALFIILVATVGVASLCTFATSYNSGAATRAMALALAQQRMERLRDAPFLDPSLKGTTSAGVSEVVTSHGRPFRVTTAVADANLVNGQPTLKRITVTVEPQGGSSAWARSPVVVTTWRSALVTGPYIS